MLSRRGGSTSGVFMPSLDIEIGKGFEEEKAKVIGLIRREIQTCS